MSAGPPAGKVLRFFMDDLNLPYVEEYGTQNSLALLRQVMDHKTFYDRVDLGFLKSLTDSAFLAGMNPTAGSFNVNERVQRHFAVFNVELPSQMALKSIFAQIANGHFEQRDFPMTVQDMGASVSAASADLHQQVREWHALAALPLPSAPRSLPCSPSRPALAPEDHWHVRVHCGST